VDEMVNAVAQKTGISQDQARVAVQTVISILKTKLPAPVASQIDGVLAGGGIAGAAGAIGGMFKK
jgi:uncharacterized protein (DUF2267 family)